ncbi:MAG: hypothetical protein ACLGIR_08430 [Actinomycetes bacterium]
MPGDGREGGLSPPYWASPEWRDVYDLRTYVEGYFGSLKNPNTEGVRRGYSQFVGLPMVSLGIALAAAVCNVRHQRKFYADRDDLHDHPLLTPDPAPRPVRELTDAEIEEHDRQHATQTDGEAA